MQALNDNNSPTLFNSKKQAYKLVQPKVLPKQSVKKVQNPPLPNIFLKDLIHIAGHDLRSPIFVIRSYAKLLQRTKEADRLDRGFKLIDEATVKMEKIINSLVQLVDTYTLQKPEVEVLLFEQSLNEVKYQLCNQIDEVKPTINSDFTSFPVVPFYKAYLNDILHLLLDNAICHNFGNNALEITVRSYKQNNKVVLEVQDNGVGVPDHNELKKLVQPFYSSSQVSDCVGIGLSKVQAIAQVCNGELELTNAKDGGFIARFLF